MALEETRTGVYERPFDTLEKFHLTVASTGAASSKEDWIVGSVVKLSIKPEIVDLRGAWIALRHLHPRIAAVADEKRENLQYTVPTSEALEQWLQKTFIVHSEGDLDASKLQRVLPPTSLFKLHYVPASRELLFRASHWRTDAIGIMLIQDAYLSILSASPQEVVFDGSEISRIAPTMDELLAPNFEVTEDVKQATQDVLSFALNGPQIASFKEAKSDIIPGETYRTSRKFSKEETQLIVSGAKTRGLTVSTALQSAVLLTASQNSAPLDGRMIYFNIFNVRKYLPAPWNGAEGSAGLYHTARLHGFNLNDEKDFASISKALQSHFAKDIRDHFRSMPSIAQLYASMVAPPIEIANQDPLSARLQFSPFGIVDDNLRARFEGSRYTLEIENWWLDVQTIKKGLLTFVWTRDGELHISQNYNEAFYEHQFVERFIEEWKSCIEKEFINP
ncbi:hypothetical protein N7462_010431 [Penicillium macrosclerotiorum]|uniref:uncharacterized protein n=1 Tax=Penicillium macrosclerotiorum TaxID=303699 RepID=UPI00254999AF|nr:uncharacterized protein N7462_010431 [Penicillium macrosclerotiorum]KAJ5669361.1 hypothetical protein N7462_010431 [Penicillium macrosclerotiorum]